ncbi:glycosyltransferase family A protein [Lewinella sp. 4G2]|uniref:glycosyltransferase family A protein n=1 Tax=Lewinella sp. 4G2 TaxID=1803372 RepID=UPI0007B4A4FD|nr:glycosyltransferase [Lewinella sp. 4G2]OAV44318.1 hypothetical protein A3850_007345 [Lewinella sp. 4G2]
MPTHLIIPTHNRPNLLSRCLKSIAALGEELTGTVVHVVENGSNVSQAIAQQYAQQLNLRFTQTERGNKSLALNQVIKDIGNDNLLIFLDDDVAVRPGIITAFQKAHDKYGPGHYFGGVLYPDYEVEPKAEHRSHLPPSARMIDNSQGKDYREFTEFQLFMGAVWACHAGDLAAIGGFNAAFGPGAKSGARGQEMDAELRLFENGVKPVFVRAAAVDHYVTAKMVTPDYAVERIFLSSMHLGRERPALIHSLGLTAKLIYSFLLLPFAPNSIGHRYRIAKAAGYFIGLARRSDD